VVTARTRSAAAPADPINQFFADLTQPGHLATFESESATLRFEVPNGARAERWYVTIRDGDVSVARQGGSTDAIVMTDRPVLEAIVSGRLNAQAALLRGLVTCQGSMAALMMFQRCLPGPPGSTGRVAPISSQTVIAQHDVKQRRPM
jgi:putative sterol carrier protein